MCADLCFHDTGKGNPHAHILLTMRPIEQSDGSWDAKQRKQYILDERGEKIYDSPKRTYKCKSVPTVDWNEHTKAEEWRKVWAAYCNSALRVNGHNEVVDWRSYVWQGVEQIPTVHPLCAKRRNFPRPRKKTLTKQSETI
ncbi:MAG: MobA/MobL family protein [Oscillospiraceae bacterium]|jgi:hypothetical protein|nr:MobA/MobL family protein [Oscillospiraceae bacterium]